ncbi:serine/threonine-protein kinase [Mycolicibacterium komossense]|uniref:non-specific serine/threonine protein kinase n=1 Tax=Mycolicibacterium komossense TaxID=1779 RepID=A0ABT3C7F3_9MYCO|nr:serine/threonine-protein kinase [Mycolicibacterium komossense]MCV7225414.1 protein kinase [Mycolicibacterium komossense]
MSNEERIHAALPDYTLGGSIGGWGQVLSASHKRSRRSVAIKQIPLQLANDPAVRRRFANEARHLLAIRHPHVVPVYDYIEDQDLCLLIMEYLPGGSVESRFADQGFTAQEAVAIALAAAAGLEGAHQEGVLHCELTPANLLFADDGNIKLTDVGVAKIVGGDNTLNPRAGGIIGSPTYLAPEQARGECVSPATDVYALAATLYYLLSGVLPHPHAGDSTTTLLEHACAEPMPLTEVAPGVPEAICAHVMRGLATDPAQRFSSAESFGVVLAGCAAQCWGPDWLPRSGVSVLGNDAITTAARAAAGGNPAGAENSSQEPPVDAPTRVRPALKQHCVEHAEVGRDRDRSGPVRIARMDSSRWAFIVTGVLGVAALVLALVGVAQPQRGGDLPAGAIKVAGVDPTSGGDVAVDATGPIPITITGLEGDRAILAMNVLGRRVDQQETLPIPAGRRRLPTTVTVNPWFLVGRATVEVTVVNGHRNAGTYRFGMTATQPASRTAGMVFAFVVALMAMALMEKNIRALSRGSEPAAGGLGIPVCGAAVAVAVAALAWILLGRELSAPGLIGCAVLAAAAGVAVSLGARRVGRRVR